MNIVVISLERATDRRERIKSQLKERNIDGIIMDAVDGQNLSEEEKNKKIHLLNGYRFGEIFKPGEIACTMSHTKAVQIAKDNNWPYLIILEDDIIMAEDFEKRINFLFRILPSDWEHVYLSGTPRLNFGIPPNLQYANIVSSIFTECTFSMLINNTVYTKIIDKLSKFETTTDDMYNDMITKKELNSYTYYPFVSYSDDDYTYIWNIKTQRTHKSKLYFKNTL